MLLNADTENGFRYDKEYLVQTKEYDNEGEFTITRLLMEYEVIDLIDMMDCSNIIDYEIYRINGIDELGKLSLQKLHYKGWQPCCLIEVVDEEGNIVISGTGTDH